jgi:hypothetical protein
MSTIPYEAPDETWENYETEEPLGLPRRRRRQLLTPISALLLAVIVGAACFYAGVRVEKGQMSSSPTNPLSALASAASRGGATGAGARSGRLGGAASLLSRGGAGSFLSGAFGGGTFGTVASVNGRNVFVTETGTGNTVRVKLSSATTITKSENVGKSSIRPGDSVIVSGVKAKNGTVAATSVSDSGNRSAGTGASSSSSSSSSGSAVSSLFSSGG